MRAVLGVIVGAAGAITAAYFALVVLFVGGISQTIDAFQAEPVDGVDAAWGIAQVLLASTAFGIGFWVSIVVGGLIGGFHKRL
jgi:hypothetical protein